MRAGRGDESESARRGETSDREKAITHFHLSPARTGSSRRRRRLSSSVSQKVKISLGGRLDVLQCGEGERRHFQWGRGLTPAAHRDVELDSPFVCFEGSLGRFLQKRPSSNLFPSNIFYVVGSKLWPAGKIGPTMLLYLAHY